MCTLGQETDSLAPHNPHNSTTSETAATLTLTQSRDSFSEARAATDSAVHAPGTIAVVPPTNTANFLKGVFHLLKPFCQFKRHKRLHTLPSSLYKSSAEEDSRRSDILKPNLKARSTQRHSLKKKMSICVCVYSSQHNFFQNRDDSSDSKSNLASRKTDLAFGKSLKFMMMSFFTGC